MVHQMHLLDIFFEKVKNKVKTYEVRVYDEKRRKINKGDTILFSKHSSPDECLLVEVKDIRHFSSFKDVFSSTDSTLVGFEKKSTEDVIEQFYNIYSNEEEQRWGIVLFEISLI